MRKEVREAARLQAAIQAAQERLKTAPDDPDACQTVGAWLCMEKGDWDEGLKLLAKGNDAALKALAAKDLESKPSAAGDKATRGDAWWDAAESAAGKTRAIMRRRASELLPGGRAGSAAELGADGGAKAAGTAGG